MVFVPNGERSVANEARTKPNGALWRTSAARRAFPGAEIIQILCKFSDRLTRICRKTMRHGEPGFQGCLLGSRYRVTEKKKLVTGKVHVVPIEGGILAGDCPGFAANRRFATDTEDADQRGRGHVRSQGRCYRHETIL